jgi:hypothetical protein
MLGHRVIESINERYSPFDPADCPNAKVVISEKCREVSRPVPNAFYRGFTASDDATIYTFGVNNG